MASYSCPLKYSRCFHSELVTWGFAYSTQNCYGHHLHVFTIQFSSRLAFYSRQGLFLYSHGSFLNNLSTSSKVYSVNVWENVADCKGVASVIYHHSHTHTQHDLLTTFIPLWWESRCKDFCIRYLVIDLMFRIRLKHFWWKYSSIFRCLQSNVHV